MTGNLWVGGIALGGTNQAGTRMWDVAPSQSERQVVSPDIANNKALLEALQFSDFLHFAQLAGATGALEHYELGSDPPDLVVTVKGGTPLGVELTTLSVTDLSRQRVNEILRIAGDLSARLASNPAQYAHLIGRTVSLAEHQTDDKRPQSGRGKKRPALIDALATELAKDFGVAFEFEVDASGHVPAEEAQKGRRQVGEYAITVCRAPQPDTMPKVVADIQGAVDAVDVRERLLSSIDAKDRPENDILLISVGMFDSRGYVQTADEFVFQTLKQIASEGLQLAPTHLDQIILHRWGSGDMLLMQRPGAPILAHSDASV